MRDVKDDAAEFYAGLVANAQVFFDNEKRENGISEVYTEGRNHDGSLNGAIIPSDIQKMFDYGEEHGLMYDTLVLPQRVWFSLLREPDFAQLLYSRVIIVPTLYLPYDKTTETSHVLVLDSRHPQISLVAKSVKVSAQVLES